MTSDTAHRKCYRLRTAKVVLFAGTLLLLFLTSCGQTQPTNSFSKIVEPPKHPIINLIMIGIQEDLAVEAPAEIFPAGSTFCVNNSVSKHSAPWLTPSLEPRTAAGAVMTIGQLLAWFNDLEVYGAATSYMTMQLAAVPDKTASVSKARTILFPSNWTFDRNGARKRNRDTSRSGAIVTATPTLTENPDILKIALDCRVSSIQLQKLTAAHGTLTENPGDAIPMKIELPSRTLQDLNIEFSLEYGHAIILAHQIARVRSQPAIRQHILYLTALTRSPVWPKTYSSPSEPLHEPQHALVLYWPQYPGRVEFRPEASHGEAASNQVLLRGLSHDALTSRLQLLQNEGIADSRLLGIALARGCVATFDTGGKNDYVSGLMKDTSSEGADSQTFDIRTARSGISLQCAMASTETFPDIDVNTCLASAPQIERFTREMPTPRKPVQSNLMEKFTFQTCTQQVASFEQHLATTDNHMWELNLPFRTARNGIPIQSQNTDPTTWAVLFFQRPLEDGEITREPPP